MSFYWQRLSSTDWEINIYVGITPIIIIRIKNELLKALILSDMKLLLNWNNYLNIVGLHAFSLEFHC